MERLWNQIRIPEMRYVCDSHGDEWLVDERLCTYRVVDYWSPGRGHSTLFYTVRSFTAGRTGLVMLSKRVKFGSYGLYYNRLTTISL